MCLAPACPCTSVPCTLHPFFSRMWQISCARCARRNLFSEFFSKKNEGGIRYVLHRHALARMCPALCIRFSVALGRFPARGVARRKFIFGIFSKNIYIYIAGQFGCVASVVRVCSPFLVRYEAGWVAWTESFAHLVSHSVFFPICIFAFLHFLHFAR